MAKYFIGLLAIFILLASCKKKIELFTSEPLSDYYPMQVGKYITYNLDSTLYIKFGQKDTVIHYQAQDRVDAQITDNLGRTAYRILRFIRQDTSQPWAANNTFMVIPAGNTVEYVGDNLRFIKLALPIKEGFSWKGNSFIDTYSNLDDLSYFDDWNYTYAYVGQPVTINNINIDSSITVNERDESLQDPSIPGTLYAEKTYSVEKYGKGIGLIYREFLHWEFQGPQSPSPGYTGYGIKMSIIDHN